MSVLLRYGCVLLYNIMYSYVYYLWFLFGFGFCFICVTSVAREVRLRKHEHRVIMSLFASRCRARGGCNRV